MNLKCCITFTLDDLLEAFHAGLRIGLRKRPQRGRFEWSLEVKPKRKECGMPVEIKITNEQQVTAHLKPVTATGKPAKLDGKPTWSVASGDVAVEVAEDGLSAVLVSRDTPGDSQVLVEADADLGEGVETISDIISVTVTGANAANLGLTLDKPEPKPEV